MTVFRVLKEGFIHLIPKINPFLFPAVRLPGPSCGIAAEVIIRRFHRENLYYSKVYLNSGDLLA